MEKILVALDPEKTSVWTVVHGLNLARRIHAKLFILIVSGCTVSEGLEKPLPVRLKEEVESLIEEARSEGISVELYIASGAFDEEVVKFIRDNKVTLLVLGVPPSCKKGASTKFFDFVEKIRRRVDCRIEIVNEKGVKITSKRSE
ncbi:MAG: universal stress protein [Deltaproteobacteria bacterium]|nr:universal stress protein [Deltaproteobacteria bacterium]MBW2082539.1 universal stress protein [Deltaproteobacteria bacterium]